MPKGLILGPLLFILHINDLPSCNLLSDVRMYADDTNLMFPSIGPKELFSLLTHDFGNLKQWPDSNRLSLNVLKTKGPGKRRHIVADTLLLMMFLGRANAQDTKFCATWETFVLDRKCF